MAVTSRTATLPSVGLVGLGAMGAPIAANLMASGHLVSGFDISPERLKSFQASGGSPAGTLAELARRSSVILTVLPSAAALADACDGLVASAEAGDHSVPDVVELSTLGYETKLGARRRLASGGIAMLDGALSGTAVQAQTADLVVYISGNRATLDRCLGTLRSIGRSVHDLGAFGNATKTKLVANHLVAVHIAAAAEALLLARRCGLEPGDVLGALIDGAGTSRMLEVRGPMMTAAAFEPASMRLELFLKDVALIEALGRGADSPMPLFESAARFFRGAAGEGRTNEDTAAVFSWLERQPGPTRP